MKTIRKILLFLTTLFLVLAAVAYFYLKQQAPQYSGEIKSDKIQKETEILFDEYGIPHIYAQNAEDAYFALGYAHAQERLFQMTLISRLVEGRMAELLGEQLLETDRYFRTIGVQKEAERMAAIHLSERKTSRQKEAGAYIDGINHFINTANSPIEFKLLGIEKTPFTEVDIFANLIFTSMTFIGGHKSDIVLEQIKNVLGDAYLEDLFMNSANYQQNKGIVPDSMVISNQSLSLNTVFADPFLPTWEGSNAWVIAPFRSKSGKVITANDTHIPFSQPSVWYEAHLEYPGFSFYGSYLAGIPFAAIGHNKDISWGLTIFIMDIVDLYVEKINPENPNQVWENDHWAEMDVRHEIIKVKDGDDVEFDVQTTRHGPIMNEAVKNLGDKPVSLWWSLFDVSGDAVNCFYDLAHAKNIDEARNAAMLNDFLGLNIMYGDKDGNIAWWASGKIPKRPAHVNPAVFLDGASGTDDYLGFYDFSDNPMMENPPSGIIVSSNQEPPPVNGFIYPGYYVPNGRFDRITDLLSKKEKWSIEELKAVHADNTSTIHAGNAHFFAAKLNEINEFKADPLLDVLAEWKGDYPLESTAAVIYTKLVYYITEYILKDELGELAFKEALTSYSFKNAFPKFTQNENAPWWDDVTTKEVKETQMDILSKAFIQTKTDLVAQLGEDHTLWKWADVHTLTHVHPIGKKEPFDKIFNIGPMAAPGGNGVPNKQQYTLNPTGKYEISSGPALRILLDFADLENSLNINPTGQSGNLMSPHYSDQAVMYNNIIYRKQKMNRTDIEKGSQRLVFRNEK